MKLFAVIRTRGAGWRAGVPLEGQQDWGPHARFMNDLAARGVVVLGGPLEGTTDVLLIMRGETADDVARELDGDPWTGMDLLRVKSVAAWELRLGRLTSAS